MKADEALKRLQLTLITGVRSAVKEFELETGLTPQKITIEMTEITSYNDFKRKFDVASVRVSLGEQ